jgi:YD repeat-containing protein
MKKVLLKRSISFKIAFLIFGMIYFRCTLLGQDNPVYQKIPRVTPPSGDAAALGRYGDYPVDISTGVPAISIPIYEIQLNDFKLPLGISYHASGNKVDDIASVVGLGWALNAGGCISRTVNGLPDEVNTLDDPYVHRYMTMEGLDSLENDTRTCDLYNLSRDVDLESDSYSFNFNGYSGRFMYSSDNQLVLMTDEDIKISGGPREGFVFNTPDGNRYRFFDGDSMIVNSKSYKSCWYLNQIITANSDTITFRYNYPRRIIQGEHHPSFNCHGDASSTWKWIDYIDALKIKYLEKISFKNGTVNFTYGFDRKDLRPHRLLAINVEDSNGKVIKKINLGQSYFVSSGGNQNDTTAYKYFNRLRLDSINLTDPSNSSVLQSYNFEYNSTNLPPYFYSFNDTPNSYYSQDYWGYFNNASNTHLIPIDNPCAMSAADRNINEAAMKATILHIIKYPTGGRTEFEFETNTYGGGGTPIGGLRILNIKNFTDNQTTIPSLVKSYDYTYSGSATKWLGYQGLDYSKWFYLNMSNGYTYNYNSIPIGGISFNNGLNVIYSKVLEYSGEQEEIKTEYNFDVESEEEYDVNYDLSSCQLDFPIIYAAGFYGPQLVHHLYPLYYKDQSWRSGQLTSKIEYKKEGSSFTPIKETINTWTPYNARDVIVGLKLVPLDPNSTGCSQGGDPKCMYQYFDILYETGVKKLIKTVEKLHSTSNVIQKTTDFEYNMIGNSPGHGFVTKETLTNSVGEKAWKINRYLPEAIANKVGVYGIMNDKNMINDPIEVINGKTESGTNFYLNSTVNEWDVFAGIPKIAQIKNLNINAPSTSYTNLTDSSLKTDVTFDSYDVSGNILNVTATDNISTGYQWGYQNSYPVAKVVNAKNIILYTTGTLSGDMVFPSNYFYMMTRSFTSTVAGNISFNISYGEYPGVNKTANFTYSLTGPTNETGVLCTSSGSGCGSTGSSVTFTNLPSGYYVLEVQPNINDATSSQVHFDYNYQGQVISSTSITEFYYQSFEEYTGATEATTSSPSYAGRYYKTGSFTVPFIKPNSRSYIVEYHYWNGNNWMNMKRSYTNNMTLSDGSAIDEVRVYPSDALMTTYTYDTLVGMTSTTDENNVTTYYEYDPFGRLKYIKDQNKNILKSYDYHYKYQAVNP